MFARSPSTLLARSKDAFTSAESIGEPSWNVTPSRSVKV